MESSFHTDVRDRGTCLSLKPLKKVTAKASAARTSRLIRNQIKTRNKKPITKMIKV
jgi:hypothetical protein